MPQDHFLQGSVPVPGHRGESTLPPCTHLCMHPGSFYPSACSVFLLSPLHQTLVLQYRSSQRRKANRAPPWMGMAYTSGSSHCRDCHLHLRKNRPFASDKEALRSQPTTWRPPRCLPHQRPLSSQVQVSTNPASRVSLSTCTRGGTDERSERVSCPNTAVSWATSGKWPN